MGIAVNNKNMESKIIENLIDNYLNFKYEIPPLDDEQEQSVNPKEYLDNYFNQTTLSEIKCKVACTIKNIFKKLENEYDETNTSKFYTSSIHRDLNRSFLNIGISISNFSIGGEELNLTVNILKNRLLHLEKNLINTNSASELIDYIDDVFKEVK